MATIVTRSGKGSALTHNELDANFTNLNNDKLENVSEDTTPQLGGTLDTNGNVINDASGVNIQYGGSTKLATTSTGIDVTGRITTDGITEDTSGNVGIGVTPSTSNITNLQMIWGTLSGWPSNCGLMNNGVYNAGDKYINTDEASKLELNDGKCIFKVAPSGTADTAISWTTAMTIDNNVTYTTLNSCRIPLWARECSFSCHGWFQLRSFPRSQTRPRLRCMHTTASC